MDTTKNDLEKHIEEVSEKVGVPLKKHETTPGVGNCWYEACASLMKLNNMGTMSAKQLRKEVVDNIENCENFANVFEMIFKSDYTKLAEFKKKHHREGEFTDEDGVMTLATGYYLGVTLRIFSRTNTKKQPYTEHNENQPVIFNIFLDDRTSGHFQSLMQPKVANNPENNSSTEEPERTSDEAMEDYLKRYHTEQEVYRPLQTISVGRLDNSKKSNNPPETIGHKEDKIKQTVMKEEKSKNVIMGHSDNNQVSETKENNKVTIKTPEMPKIQKSTLQNKKYETIKETTIPKEKNITQQPIRQEGTKMNHKQQNKYKKSDQQITEKIVRMKQKGQIHTLK